MSSSHLVSRRLERSKKEIYCGGAEFGCLESLEFVDTLAVDRKPTIDNLFIDLYGRGHVSDVTWEWGWH